MLYLTGFYGSSVAWVEVDASHDGENPRTMTIAQLGEELGRAIYQLNTAVF